MLVYQILSGCDYIDSINGIGIKTAHKLLRKYKTVEKVTEPESTWVILASDTSFCPRSYKACASRARRSLKTTATTSASRSSPSFISASIARNRG